MTTPSTISCPACGAAASGRFCSSCGASLGPRQCDGCRAELSPQARFCHRCGRPVAGGVAAGGPPARSGDRAAWIFAGVLSVALVGFIVYRVTTDQPSPEVPAMTNAGAAAAGGAPPGPAPDISQMTPRERFDRLFNRIMTAAETRDSAEVQRFTPMALGAYAQLDQFDADARYHAAVLHLQSGNTDAALALADTILRETPGHLFGYVIRGTAAEQRDDRTALTQARRDFAARFPAESAAGRPEYRDHAPVLQEFRRESGP